MGRINVGELAKTAPKAFEPLPKGKYAVEVTEAEYKTFQTGSRGLVLTLTVFEPSANKGKKIGFVHLVFSEDNPGVFYSQLKNLGLDESFHAEFGDIDLDDDDDAEEYFEAIAEEILGAQVIAPVRQEKYEGRVNNKVGFFEPYKEGVATGGSGKTRRRSSTPDETEVPAETPRQRRRRSAEVDEEGETEETEQEQEQETPAPHTRRKRSSSAEPETEETPKRSRRSRPNMPPGLS
jgi:hypothetical protein